MSIPFRPSNGDHGEWFMACFCEICQADADEEKPCEILTRALAFDINDPEYPTEWVQDEDGQNQRCTAFQHRPDDGVGRLDDPRQKEMLP